MAKNNLPVPKGYTGTKASWNRLSHSTQVSTTKALQKEQAPPPLKNVPLPFIGGMPGGYSYNPNTRQREGTLPGTPSRSVPITGPGGTALYGIDNILPANFTQTPKYVKGDEWKPMSNDFTMKRDLQYKLYQLGLYDAEAEFRIGEWGEEDAAAYERALAAANANFMSVEEWLENAIANPEMAVDAQQAKEKTRAPLVVTLTDPDDLKYVAKSAAATVFGRNVKMPDEFLDQMITGFHQLQRDRQIHNYNTAEFGGETMDEPNPGAFASAEMERKYPVQSQYDELSEAMGSVLSGLFGE